jgi:phage gp36-like protein
MYATVEQVLTAFPFIGSASNVSSSVISQFIDSAEAVINAKLAERYTLPRSETIPLLTRLSIEKTVCDLTRKRTQFHFSIEMLEKSVAGLMCEEVAEMLDDIANGDLKLVDNSGNVISESTAEMQVYSSKEGYKPTMFEADYWEDMNTDPDKISDEEDSR